MGDNYVHNKLYYWIKKIIVFKILLERLSKYEKRDKQHILYDIFYKDNESSLLHMHAKSTFIYVISIRYYTIQLSYIILI